MDSFFIPLGSGYSLPWDVHPSLALLHQLKLFNFPIPKGIILLNPLIPEGRLDLNYSQALEMELRNRDFSSPLLVFVFKQNSPEPLSLVVESASDLIRRMEIFIGECFPSQPGLTGRWDLLICEKPQATVLGTALSQAGFLDDWVSFCLLTENGVFPENHMPVEKLAAGEKRLRGDFRGRLQELLRSVRNALGEDNWLLSWSDDGENICLCSISSCQKTNSLEDSYSQISAFENTPNIPSVLESSLIALSSEKLFQFFGRWALGLSPNRIWVRQQANRLLFNYSLLEDFLRSFGLSTQALALVGVQTQKQPHPSNSVRFWRSLPRLVRLLHHLSLSPAIANRLSGKLRNFDTSPEKQIRDLFMEWQSVYISVSHCFYRIWSFYFIIGSLLRILGLPSNLLQLQRDSLSPWIRWFLFPLLKFQEKLNLAESVLRESSRSALSKINQCIEMKSLGWFARGLLPSSEHIWVLDYESALQLDNPSSETQLTP